MTNKFITTQPRLFAAFIQSANNLERELALYESCHGIQEKIFVIFFKDIPDGCPIEISTDTAEAVVFKNYNFSDSMPSKDWEQRQLLITIA